MAQDTAGAQLQHLGDLLARRCSTACADSTAPVLEDMLLAVLKHSAPVTAVALADQRTVLRRWCQQVGSAVSSQVASHAAFACQIILHMAPQLDKPGCETNAPALLHALQRLVSDASSAASLRILGVHAACAVLARSSVWPSVRRDVCTKSCTKLLRAVMAFQHIGACCEALALLTPVLSTASVATNLSSLYPLLSRALCRADAVSAAPRLASLIASVPDQRHVLLASLAVSMVSLLADAFPGVVTSESIVGNGNAGANAGGLGILPDALLPLPAFPDSMPVALLRIQAAFQTISAVISTPSNGRCVDVPVALLLRVTLHLCVRVTDRSLRAALPATHAVPALVVYPLMQAAAISALTSVLRAVPVAALLAFVPDVVRCLRAPLSRSVDRSRRFLRPVGHPGYCSIVVEACFSAAAALLDVAGAHNLDIAPDLAPFILAAALPDVADSASGDAGPERVAKRRRLADDNHAAKDAHAAAVDADGSAAIRLASLGALEALLRSNGVHLDPELRQAVESSLIRVLSLAAIDADALSVHQHVASLRCLGALVLAPLPYQLACTPRAVCILRAASSHAHPRVRVAASTVLSAVAGGVLRPRAPPVPALVPMASMPQPELPIPSAAPAVHGFAAAATAASCGAPPILPVPTSPSSSLIPDLGNSAQSAASQVSGARTGVALAGATAVVATDTQNVGVAAASSNTAIASAPVDVAANKTIDASVPPAAMSTVSQSVAFHQDGSEATITMLPGSGVSHLDASTASDDGIGDNGRDDADADDDDDDDDDDDSFEINDVDVSDDGDDGR